MPLHITSRHSCGGPKSYKITKIRMTSRHNCGGHYNSQVPQAQSMLCVHGSATVVSMFTFAISPSTYVHMTSRHSCAGSY